jgi:hypothetical protein
MALFGKSQVLFLLTKDSLQLFIKDRQTEQVSFSVDTVKHQEIINRQKFEQLLTEFFSTSKLSASKGIIFLASDVVFQKQMPKEASEEEISSFSSTIPFSQGIIAKKTIKTTNGVFLYATNRDLYETVVLIARQQMIAINHVIPLTLFPSFSQGSEISFQSLLKAASNTQFIDLANFLQEEEDQKTKISSKKVVPIKQYAMLGASLLFLLGVISFAILNLGILPSKQQNKPLTRASTGASTHPTEYVRVMPTVVASLLQISPSEAINNANIKIQILNGSGILGQAGLVKDHLTPLGFNNIQLDNASSVSATTNMIYAKQVPESYRNSIVTELQTLFNEVEVEQVATSSGYDIVIKTGEAKNK